MRAELKDIPLQEREAMLTAPELAPAFTLEGAAQEYFTILLSIKWTTFHMSINYVSNAHVTKPMTSAWPQYV